MAAESRSPRIDAHQHLWRYNDAEYDWIGDEMRSLRRDFLLEQLRPVMREAAVDATVAVQARQTIEETRWLLSLAQAPDSPIAGVVGWLPLTADDLSTQLTSLPFRSRLCGLRHVLQAEPDAFFQNEAFHRGLAALQGTGLVYDILIYARQLPQVLRLVDRHPDQVFVLDHIGKPDLRQGGFAVWESGFRELARRPNVSCKLSGMVTETDWTRWTAVELKPYFEVALEAFGPSRLMIGTDWPVLTVGCGYGAWWRTVEAWLAPLSGEEQAQVLGKTAARVYQLGGLSEVTA